MQKTVKEHNKYLQLSNKLLIGYLASMFCACIVSIIGIATDGGLLLGILFLLFAVVGVALFFASEAAHMKYTKILKNKKKKTSKKD